jgi:hypothetical protein
VKQPFMRAQECISILSATDVLQQSPIQMLTRKTFA